MPMHWQAGVRPWIIEPSGLRRSVILMNHEGYADRTAEDAIDSVMKESKKRSNKPCSNTKHTDGTFSHKNTFKGSLKP